MSTYTNGVTSLFWITLLHVTEVKHGEWKHKKYHSHRTEKQIHASLEALWEGAKSVWELSWNWVNTDMKRYSPHAAPWNISQEFLPICPLKVYPNTDGSKRLSYPSHPPIFPHWMACTDMIFSLFQHNQGMNWGQYAMIMQTNTTFK